MTERTAIEIDEELLRRAKRALSWTTTLATVEEALRRATAEVESTNGERAARQKGCRRGQGRQLLLA